MKRIVAILVLMVMVLSISVTALAYPDGSDSSKKTSLPYSSNFGIVEGTQTKYWFTPSGKTVNCALSSLKWGVSKDTTLYVKLFTYNSSGSWSLKSSGSVSIKSGTAPDQTVSLTSTTGAKTCGGFSKKKEYTDYPLKADFSFSNKK